MKKIIVLISLLINLLTGCENNMKYRSKIIENLEQVNTPAEERIVLEEFVSVIRNNNTLINIDLNEDNKSIPIQMLNKKLNSTLIVRVSFDDGSSFQWKPLDNKNIFLLMRE